jgi:hypothetical protein
MLCLAQALEISNITGGSLITDSRLFHNKRHIMPTAPSALYVAIRRLFIHAKSTFQHSPLRVRTAGA